MTFEYAERPFFSLRFITRWVGKIFYEFLNCAFWPDFIFHAKHQFYFCSPIPSIFTWGLCVLLSAWSWLPHSQPSSSPTFFQSIVFPKTPVSCDPVSKLAASQFLLLSLVSTWHLSHCFQAQTSFPCLFLLLFTVFLLLFLPSQLSPGAGSSAESELRSPLCSSPSPCFFYAALPHHFQQMQRIPVWWQCKIIHWGFFNW